MSLSASTNPLLEPSTLPFGMPDYSLIEAGHYLPAFDAAIEAHVAEVIAIVDNDEAPTFDNTLVALERAGQTLSKVAMTFFTVAAADATDDIQQIEEAVSPKLSAHSDFIDLNPGLFSRIRTVFEQRGSLGLDAESIRLVERRYESMVNAGVALEGAERERLTAINSRLSTLTTLFQKLLLADTNDQAVVFESADELAGLSDDELAAAARTAKDRGLEGRWVLPLRLFSSHPALSSLRNRESRKRVLEASLTRAGRGNTNDTSETLLEIVRLRAERAELLGHDTAADQQLSPQMAGSGAAAQELLKRLAHPAARNVEAERADRQHALDTAESAPFDLEAHDWPYYTELVRKEQYALDTAALAPWFEAERVLHDGVFFAATKLYGVTFAERDDLRSYHDGVRVFEVTDDDGEPLGLFVLDLYTRATKRGGAWMNSLVTQSALLGEKPVVVNNLNVTEPPAGTKTLLTLDEVTTLFHEFGHALHGLLSDVTYPYFSGTSVTRDFVEFPSQVNEMWILWPEVLANYAKHIDTGEPLPAELVKSLTESTAFNEGFATSEYLAAAWIDQAWHSLSLDEASAVADVTTFERDALSDIGLLNPLVPPRYASRYFQHIFAGGYMAGYYSYIWSEVLDADTVEWFGEHGGLTRENGDRFRERVLSVGGSKDPMDAYRDFRGRDPEVAPLLRRRGLE